MDTLHVEISALLKGMTQRLLVERAPEPAKALISAAHAQLVAALLEVILARVEEPVVPDELVEELERVVSHEASAASIAEPPGPTDEELEQLVAARKREEWAAATARYQSLVARGRELFGEQGASEFFGMAVPPKQTSEEGEKHANQDLT